MPCVGGIGVFLCLNQKIHVYVSLRGWSVKPSLPQLVLEVSHRVISSAKTDI